MATSPFVIHAGCWWAVRLGDTVLACSEDPVPAEREDVEDGELAEWEQLLADPDQNRDLRLDAALSLADSDDVRVEDVTFDVDGGMEWRFSNGRVLTLAILDASIDSWFLYGPGETGAHYCKGQRS